MGNCLKTQLKSIVDNSNLNKIGELTFSVSGRITNSVLNFNPNTVGKTVKLTCVDGTACLSMNNDGSNPVSTVTKSENSNSYFLASTPLKKFKVENKYDIQRCGIYGGTIEDLNINDLDYCELQSITVYADTDSPKVYGNLAKLISNKSELFGITLKAVPNVIINIAACGLNYPILKNIEINECNITGTVVDYVAAARTKATSGEINSSAAEWHLNDGRTVYTKAQGKIIWDASTITVQASSGDIVINA